MTGYSQSTFLRSSYQNSHLRAYQEDFVLLHRYIHLPKIHTSFSFNLHFILHQEGRDHNNELLYMKLKPLSWWSRISACRTAMAFLISNFARLKLTLRHCSFTRDADADRLFGLGLGAVIPYHQAHFWFWELLLRGQHVLQRSYRTELSSAQMITLKLGRAEV